MTMNSNRTLIRSTALSALAWPFNPRLPVEREVGHPLRITLQGRISSSTLRTIVEMPTRGPKQPECVFTRWAGETMVMIVAPDQATLVSLMSGNEAVRLQFKTRLADIVVRICRTQSPRATSPKPHIIRNACHYIWTVFRFERFACLSGWDGRADFDTYLYLTVRKRLEAYVPKLLERRLEDGRSTFLTLFGRSIEWQIAKLFRIAEEREDAFDDVIVSLWETNAKAPGKGPSYRLKAHRNEGSYAAFVHKVVGNLLIDIIRSKEGRSPLPASVKRLPELERYIYQALYRDSTPPTASALMAVVAWRIPGVKATDVAAAYRRLRDCLLADERRGQTTLVGRPETEGHVDRNGGTEVTTGGGATGTAASPFPPPDAGVQDDEGDLFAAAEGALRALLATFSEDERSYVELTLQGTKRNRMPWPLKETDQIKRRVRAAFLKFKQDNKAAARWHWHISTNTGAAL